MGSHCEKHRDCTIRFYPSVKHYTHLCAFLTIRAEELTTTIVEMFDVLVGRLFSLSDDDLMTAKAKEQQTHLESQSKRVARRIARGKNSNVRVEGDEPKLIALEKIEVPQEVTGLRADLIDLFPPT